MRADATALPLGFPADVWSLAATILFAFSGVQPYQGLGLIQIISALTVQRQAPDVSAAVPAALRHTLELCFSFDASQRPQVGVLVQALQVCQHDIDHALVILLCHWQQ